MKLVKLVSLSISVLSFNLYASSTPKEWLEWKKRNPLPEESRQVLLGNIQDTYDFPHDESFYMSQFSVASYIENDKYIRLYREDYDFIIRDHAKNFQVLNSLSSKETCLALDKQEINSISYFNLQLLKPAAYLFKQSLDAEDINILLKDFRRLKETLLCVQTTINNLLLANLYKDYIRLFDLLKIKKQQEIAYMPIPLKSVIQKSKDFVLGEYFYNLSKTEQIQDSFSKRLSYVQLIINEMKSEGYKDEYFFDPVKIQSWHTHQTKFGLKAVDELSVRPETVFDLDKDHGFPSYKYSKTKIKQLMELEKAKDPKKIRNFLKKNRDIISLVNFSYLGTIRTNNEGLIAYIKDYLSSMK